MRPSDRLMRMRDVYNNILYSIRGKKDGSSELSAAYIHGLVSLVVLSTSSAFLTSKEASVVTNTK